MKKIWVVDYFFPWAISLWRVETLYPKIVINYPKTYEKLHCKGEPYRITGLRDPSVQTYRHTHTDPVTLL